MIIRTWAEEFAREAVLDAQRRRHVALHVADTAVAFFAGCRAPEAQALARFYGIGSIEDQAAAVAAVIRRTECDDIHVASCVTPGSVVVPVALAHTAMEERAEARFERGVAAGYAVGLKIGAALGGASALGTGIWPTYFAAPMMAAATASVCLGLDAEHMAAALALAATGAGGRAGRISGHPSGRWLAIGEAVSKGSRAARAAAQGFQGDAGVISAEWLAAIADPKFIQPEALLKGDGIASVGFKPIVAARQTINAVFAFQTILQQGVDPRGIDRIDIRVPPVHAAMVAKPATADDRLSTIANIHLQIAAAALRQELLYDIERQGQPASDLIDFASRIFIIPDETLDVHLPDVWAARVTVTIGERRFHETCTVVPGDPADGDAEPLVRTKLARLVPREYHAACEAVLDTTEEQPWSALWRDMTTALV